MFWPRAKTPHFLLSFIYYLLSFQSFRFLQPQHQVHALYGGAGAAFSQVIKQADQLQLGVVWVGQAEDLQRVLACKLVGGQKASVRSFAERMHPYHRLPGVVIGQRIGHRLRRDAERRQIQRDHRLHTGVVVGHDRHKIGRGVQPCDGGYDYTIYDKGTMRALDGGQLDAPELPLSTAALKICEMHDMGGQSIQYAPLSMIETLQEAAVQQMQAAAQAAAPETTMLPDAPEQHLDEYPMPDPTLTQDDLEKSGYLDGDLLPLSKERAYELMERDLTVYIVQQGENPAMAFDTTDLDAYDGIFAVTREEWEESPAFDAQVKERMDHQQEREQAFLDHKGDCFSIYQVKHTDELRDIRYEGLEWLKSIGQTAQRDNYDLVYTAPLLPSDLKGDTAEQLFYRFNNEHPADYRHPSMSVSDIVAIKRDGKVSCHYCDSFDFAEVPGFLPDNPLKNAEMAVEDDYGMIDGILNNGQRQPPQRELPEKRKSVVEQLKSQPKPEHKKTAPKKSAEREI